MMTIVAVVLRGGIAPAHVWQPPALAAVSAPTALLLAAAPAGVALFGGEKLLAGAEVDIKGFCLAVGLVATLWSSVGGLAQRRPLPTLGYAAAASAALLLVVLPTGPAAAPVPWLVLSLLACCSAVPVVGLLHPGPGRSSAITAVIFLHGLGSGYAAVVASRGLSAGGGVLVSVIAVLATMLLTLAVRRTTQQERQGQSGEAVLHVLALGVLAAVGLGFAWREVGVTFASLWPALVGIGLGMILFRVLPPRAEPRIPPGDILGRIERAAAWFMRALVRLCGDRLPRYRDQVQRTLVDLWRRRSWAEHIAKLESRLAAWSATSTLLLLVAIAAAILLVS